MSRSAWLGCLALVASAPLAARRVAAQSAASGEAFLDPEARAILDVARARWRSGDTSLVRYQARVSQRMAADLRLPLHDRVVYRYEAAARMIWQRDGGVAVQMLAAREEFPWGLNRSGKPDGVFQQGYDPRRDPLILGLEYTDNPEIRAHHPLAEDAETYYRFRSGDTLTVTLPDGRSLHAVELQMLPRTDDPHSLTGSLWIEPKSGALVRAVYRPARDANLETDTRVDLSDPNIKRIPSMFRPFTVTVGSVTVEYALWDMRVWMPRSVRAEGTLHAGVVSMPMTLDMTYDVEDAVTVDQNPAPLGLPAAVDRLATIAAEDGQTTWHTVSRTRRRLGITSYYVMPENPAWLLDSPDLPPPIWDDATGTASAADLARDLNALPRPREIATGAAFEWAPKRLDLLRYNRVEGLSVGVRETRTFSLAGAPASAALVARLGSADRDPRGRLTLTRESAARTLSLAVFDELEPMVSSRALGLGNSLGALLLGRDDGDYFDATGTAVRWTPPSGRRSWYDVRAYAERQEPVAVNTQASLLSLAGGRSSFRAQAAADRADQVGVEAALSPWVGSGTASPGAGLDLQVRGETGDFTFARASLGLRATLPVVARVRLAGEVAGGTTWGNAPVQQLWRLGGPASLRAFDPGVVVGPSFVRARVEMARPLLNAPGVGGLALAVFSDAGSAGSGSNVRWTNAVASAGAGLSLLDGTIRIDAARGWHGPSGYRIDIYLDGLL